MWPGQQPPGGEQNPQDQKAPNPYQQPGYQQPNPYQQPGYQQPGYPQAGYQQPNPYQQPTAPYHAVPGQPPGPPVPPDGDRRKTTIVAVVAALAVLAAAGVTGYLVLGDDGEQSTARGGPAPSGSAAAPSAPVGQPPQSPSGNPRDGSAAPTPSVPGWKVVHNPKRDTLFDIPPDWEALGSGLAVGFEDEKAGDGSPVVTMSAPGRYKSEWCTYDDDKDGTAEEWSLATAGTKGGQGAKNTAEAAYNEAGSWVWAGYAQTEPKGTVKITKAVPYTTKSGLRGHVATATALNTKHEHKCDTDGKSIAFSFKNARGDFVSWVLYANTGVKEEVPDETVRKILSTVRLVGTAS
ncbi:hypothetical protein LUX05_00230 [Streptomyces somaliensis]|uniref:hypothetical protein n=1 Tax=Streptomyces somaliensis TaxID=78355 RepID=UPI0034E95E75|nr:hypothetical protein [Streptomyces somaliensis]MCP9972991.1 hypothetical protein [Streptomyces somaliensis]